MKRSPMKPGKGFARPLRPASTKLPIALSVPEQSHRSRMLTRDEISRTVTPVPKERPVRSARYLRLVAMLPCLNCGIEGFSNACHGDEGKGMAIKADDRTCWPGCVDRPGVVGCHSLIGASGILTRNERRELEQRYARMTRARIKHMGLWPTDLEWLE